MDAVNGGMKMKKLILFMMLVAAAVISMPTNSCEAQDVWVEHWNYEDVDIYVMDDTLKTGTSGTGKFFKVSVKEVRDGELLSVVDWTFSKYKTDMWRYVTSNMRGNNTTVVIPRNQIFEFCMKSLGWSYRLQGSYYY